MTLDFYIYSLTVAGLAGIVIFSFFYASFLRNLLLKLSFIVALGGIFVSIYTLLGNPIPVNPITRWVYSEVDRAVVLYYEVSEGHSIIMLLRLNNRITPLWVRYEWSKNVAGKLDQLQREINLKKVEKDEAERRSRRDGTPNPPHDETDEEIVIHHPFDLSLEERSNDFHHESPTRAGPRKDEVIQNQTNPGL